MFTYGVFNTVSKLFCLLYVGWTDV
jgi:hypothetical protein